MTHDLFILAVSLLCGSLPGFVISIVWFVRYGPERIPVVFSTAYTMTLALVLVTLATNGVPR